MRKGEKKMNSIYGEHVSYTYINVGIFRVISIHPVITEKKILIRKQIENVSNDGGKI